MVVFEKVRWKNLLSTGNSWTEIVLSGSPMTLVVGKNGAGKSTLIDALCYGLFGKPYRKVQLGDLINSINQAELRVEIEFRVGAIHYKVVRGMKPGVFEIWHEGVLINQDAATRDHQRYLEKTILGFSHKTFTQIVLVGSALYTPFMKLPTLVRREIVEDLLDIGIFSVMNRVLKVRYDELIREIDTIRIDIKSTLDKITIQTTHLRELERTKENTVERKQSDLRNWQEQITQLKANCDLIVLHTASLEKSIEDRSLVENKTHRGERVLAQLEGRVNRLNKDVIFYQTHDDCPTCHQVLLNKDGALANASTEIIKYSEGISTIKSTLNVLSDRSSQISTIQKNITDHKNELIRLRSQIDELHRYCDILTTEINTVVSANTTNQQVQDLSKELYAQLEVLNARRKVLVDERTYIETALILLKDTGIKSHIIHQYLPTINKTINQYLSAMDFYVAFTLDEEFRETIKSRHRDNFSYDNFSEGQKRRIDLSLLFTWRAIAKLKNSVNTNLLILDEVLDGSLDSDGLEEFSRLLRVFSESTNVFVISHRGDLLVDKFNHVIKFDLVGNFSEATV